MARWDKGLKTGTVPVKLGRLVPVGIQSQNLFIFHHMDTLNVPLVDIPKYVVYIYKKHAPNAQLVRKINHLNEDVTYCWKVSKRYVCCQSKTATSGDKLVTAIPSKGYESCPRRVE